MGSGRWCGWRVSFVFLSTVVRVIFFWVSWLLQLSKHLYDCRSWNRWGGKDSLFCSSMLMVYCKEIVETAYEGQLKTLCLKQMENNKNGYPKRLVSKSMLTPFCVLTKSLEIVTLISVFLVRGETCFCLPVVLHKRAANNHMTISQSWFYYYWDAGFWLNLQIFYIVFYKEMNELGEKRLLCILLFQSTVHAVILKWVCFVFVTVWVLWRK